MNKLHIVVPFVAVSSLLACTAEESAAPEVRAEVRVSASIQADIAGLAGVSVKLTPAPTCEDYPVIEGDGTPYASQVDITQMAYPNGAPFGTPDEYTHALADTVFASVVPGCYEVVVAPVGADGEPLGSCRETTVPVVVDEYTSLIFDVPVRCDEVPREELDVQANNAPPYLDAITVEPMVSSCDVTVVCATAHDADFDVLEFVWPRPDGLEPGTGAWPTILSHTRNPDRSITQCVGVQARDSGTYELGVEVYDVTRTTGGMVRIEDQGGVESHAMDSVTIDATLGCEATGRSAVILLTLDNDPGLPRDRAGKLIANTVDWIRPSAAEPTSVLVVLDDNHHGEDADDGEFVTDMLLEMNYDADFMREPTGGLDYTTLLDYDVVWFVNPGYEVDDPMTHTALLRYRASGGGLVLQGDDIARFRNNPEFMAPLTYLAWQDNGTLACGLNTDNNAGSTYKVTFEIPTDDPHPMAEGLEQYEFKYGNDIDLTRPLGKGERVLAWAEVETENCELRTPAVVALDPEALLAWQ